jgi:hypothetical protein
VEQLARRTKLSVNAFLSSLDASSKRWLAAFALLVVVTNGLLAYSFFSGLTPPKEVVQSPVTTVKTRASSQPTWNSAEQNRSTGYPNYIPPTPSIGNKPTVPLATSNNWVKVVHMQADDLRKKVAESGDSTEAKQRTLDQIDEMEQKGLLIQ